MEGVTKCECGNLSHPVYDGKCEDCWVEVAKLGCKTRPRRDEGNSGLKTVVTGRHKSDRTGD